MIVVLRHVLGWLCITVSIVFVMAGLVLGFMVGATHNSMSTEGARSGIRNAFIVIGAFIVIPAGGAFTLITGKENVSKKRKKATVT